MKRIDPDFDETRYRNAEGEPIKRFKDFLAVAESRGIIRLEGEGRNVYAVLVEDETEAPAEAETENRPIPATLVKAWEFA